MPDETILSARDVRFLLHDWLDIGALTATDRHDGQSRDDYDEVLALAERIATERFAPHNRISDENEPRMEDGRVVLTPEIGDALSTLAEAGLVGVSLPAEVGGMQLPHALSTAISAWLHAANPSTSAYSMLTGAAANMLSVCGSAEQAQRWVPGMVEGRYMGTMCLSEPQAGSSLADITTRAEPQDDGTYRVFGTKMWISAGDHELSDNIVHMVLAKVAGGGAGVKGIGLFVVPRVLDDDGADERNDVVLAGLNHKLGYRGAVNTVLGFGEGEHEPGGERGAVAYLIGEPHRGLEYMFQMMNEARIGVGTGAVGIGYTGYLKALQYARERPQGRPLTDRDPEAPQVPIAEHPDVRRMLLASKSYAEGGLALVLYCGRLTDTMETTSDENERQRASLLLEILTPIAKSWPSQWCLEANALAIQVHGGYGYSREYDVEQHWRDNRLNPIHEGTHGIQALDLLRRKARMADGAAFGALVDAVSATVAAAREAGGEAGALADRLDASLDALREATAAALADRESLEPALANATAYLEATGHIVVAWLWLDVLLAAQRAETLEESKRACARYFFAHELPKVHPQLALVRELDRTVLDTDPAVL